MSLLETRGDDQFAENVEELNVVSLPFGNYSGIVVFDGNKISFKFIVRK